MTLAYSVYASAYQGHDDCVSKYPEQADLGVGQQVRMRVVNSNSHALRDL